MAGDSLAPATAASHAEETRPVSRLSRRSYLLAPLALVAGLGLAACGNQGVSIQSREHSTARGVDGQVGEVLVRNAEITLGLDGTGLLSVALFNDGSAADSLMSVSSPRASDFELPAGATVFAGAYAGTSPSTTRTVASASPAGPEVSSSQSLAATNMAPGAATSTATGTASSTASRSPTGSPTVQPASEGASSITLPGQTGVFLNSGLTQVTVRGLPADAAVGMSLPVTFSFVGAGMLTLQVPISGAASTGASGNPLPTVSDADNQGGPPSRTPPPG